MPPPFVFEAMSTRPSIPSLAAQQPRLPLFLHTKPGTRLHLSRTALSKPVSEEPNGTPGFDCAPGPWLHPARAATTMQSCLDPYIRHAIAIFDPHCGTDQSQTYPSAPQSRGLKQGTALLQVAACRTTGLVLHTIMKGHRAQKTESHTCNKGQGFVTSVCNVNVTGSCCDAGTIAAP